MTRAKKSDVAERGMRVVFYSASIRDGIYRTTIPEFRLEVDAEADDAEIEECIREEILRNRLQWDWRAATGDES